MILIDDTKMMVKGDSAELLNELEKVTIAILESVGETLEINPNDIRKQLNKQLKKGLGK